MRRVIDYAAVMQVPASAIAREWARIGVTGFGGPPAHIALLRSLCVEQRHWMTEREFEDGVAATNLLPGPASTQLAIFCAWRLGGPLGAIVGGLCFIVPGLVMILALAALFLASSPPLWVRGAAAGAGAAVPIVAVHAASGLMPASWRRVSGTTASRVRWLVYVTLGGVAAATVGAYVVAVLAACGVVEVVAHERGSRPRPRCSAYPISFSLAAAATGGLGALSWVAFKVGALSYGGGFVIIPLMQRDTVEVYHWMTGPQFLNAVALGQVTPGPVVLTVAVVGFAAAGVGGGLLATAVAFAPSFVFVLVGARHFDALRHSERAQAFLTGAGAAAIGAIAGAAVPLGLELEHAWQVGVLALAAIWLLLLRRGVVTTLLGAGVLGVVAALAGLAVT
jgi:chromate transporter